METLKIIFWHVGTKSYNNEYNYFVCLNGPGRGGTPYNGLYGEAPPERNTFFTLQVYERVGISRVEVYERVGNLSFRYLKGPFTIFQWKVYERGPFLPKMVYKRVRGRTSGRSLPVLIFF